jgi:hypothetical protein
MAIGACSLPSSDVLQEGECDANQYESTNRQKHKPTAIAEKRPASVHGTRSGPIAALS